MKVAWFSPLPPSMSGIAAYSAELLPGLRARGLSVDTFTVENAHDFVWRRRRTPYALTVFQMGNAACHDYMWGYLFRYPGVVVLHDAQLHQARALALTKRWVPRRADYLTEFRANHPDAPAHLGELVALGGMGGTLFQHWPHIKLVVESARLTIVHNGRLAHSLRKQFPTSRIEAIDMGVADPRAREDDHSSPRSIDVRRRHGIPDDAVVIAAFGGVTPEKRIPEVLRALSAVAARHPRLRVMIVGTAARHYDVMADARAWRVDDRIHLTGYVPDAELADYLAAADVCVCLRWPSNRETSASWLRCLAAGRATLVTDLAHMADVPTVDPRGWQPLTTTAAAAAPIAVSIDILNEDHSLQLAFERLEADPIFRAELGGAARAWWKAHHQLEPMVDAYQRLLLAAASLPAPRIALPAHLTDDGSRQARLLADEIGMTDRVGDLLAP